MTAPESRVGTNFGKYELNALLGQGGMGEVYEAFDTDKRRSVALKILREEYAHNDRFRERFLRESHAAAVIAEPHVIPIHDWGEIDGNLFIDMRLVRGHTLYELIQTGPLAPDRAVDIVQQVAAALDAAHAEGLIHRDIKPQNILVTPADFAYLVDFGIAAMQGDSRLTLAGTQIGSLAYMAPERFNDEPSTPATDVYSLACVLYEALTGKTPFGAGSHESLIAAHVSKPPPSAAAANPQVPAAMDAVISRGMAKEPDDRYGSAGALARAAGRALQSAGPVVDHAASTLAAPYPPPAAAVSAPQSAWSTAPMPQSTESSRNWMVPVALVGIALLLGAVGVVIGMLASTDSEQTAAPAPPTTTLSSVVAPPPITPPATTATEAVTVSPSTTSRAAAQPDPEAESQRRLRQLATGDRAFVATQLADLWVPQLSSKRPGIVDGGVTWDNELTLQEHLQLRQLYNAKLLWSGEWSTFDHDNFWVTVVPITFRTSEGALRWCTVQNLGPNHCYAKLVSTTHPVRGSTAHN